jgi:hypothetical protein|tara:strand:- start:1335 stop:1724 length:390 start_codon:yes stop_codon:yes gene_type:complete
MTSVLNIEPNHLIVRSIKEDSVYDFLKFSKGHNIKVSKYYDLLNTIDTFKLKNVYAFIYLQIYKISGKSEGRLKLLQKRSGKISPNEMNGFLVEYINNVDDSILPSAVFVNSIVIMNSIQLYFYPHITL